MSWVAMGYNICMVCEKHYDSGIAMKKANMSGSLISLSDNAFKDNEKVCLGNGLCEEHRQPNHVALIAIDPDRSDKNSVYKTGEIAYLSREAELFNKELNEFIANLSQPADEQFAFISQPAFHVMIEDYKKIIEGDDL